MADCLSAGIVVDVCSFYMLMPVCVPTREGGCVSGRWMSLAQGCVLGCDRSRQAAIDESRSVKCLEVCDLQNISAAISEDHG